MERRGGGGEDAEQNEIHGNRKPLLLDHRAIRPGGDRFGVRFAIVVRHGCHTVAAGGGGGGGLPHGGDGGAHRRGAGGGCGGGVGGGAAGGEGKGPGGS